MSEKIHKLIILGSGPAGLTAGIYSARANLAPLIIEGSKPGGQLMSTTAVENWPGEKSIMGPQLMMNMREQVKALGTEFIPGGVAEVVLKERPFIIRTTKNKEFKAHTMIIATGATPKQLHIPGEKELWGKGVSTCAVCDGAFYKNEPVVIVGGGDTAMEEASFMTNFTDEITIVQIEPQLTASHAMQKRVIDNPKINIIYNSTVTEIHGENDKVKEVTVTNQKTGNKEKITTRAVFLAIGLKPNTEFLQGKLPLNDWGYLELKNQTRTKIEGVFGAGDVHDYRYRQAVTAAGAGCMAALDAERYLKEYGL